MVNLVITYFQHHEMGRSEVCNSCMAAWDLINRDITVKLLISRIPNETTVNDDDEHK